MPQFYGKAAFVIKTLQWHKNPKKNDLRPSGTNDAFAHQMYPGHY
jgi:hypothetical protein